MWSRVRARLYPDASSGPCNELQAGGQAQTAPLGFGPRVTLIWLKNRLSPGRVDTNPVVLKTKLAGRPAPSRTDMHFRLSVPVPVLQGIREQVLEDLRQCVWLDQHSR